MIDRTPRGIQEVLFGFFWGAIAVAAAHGSFFVQCWLLAVIARPFSMTAAFAFWVIVLVASWALIWPHRRAGWASLQPGDVPVRQRVAALACTGWIFALTFLSGTVAILGLQSQRIITIPWFGYY